MRTLLFAFILLTLSASYTHASSWTNICPSSDTTYCNSVGKNAYNATGHKALKNIKLGKIIGVTWKLKGALIGYSKPIPQAGIPGSTRLSPRNAYYYIIDDGAPKPFIRQCREINAR